MKILSPTSIAQFINRFCLEVEGSRFKGTKSEASAKAAGRKLHGRMAQGKKLCLKVSIVVEICLSFYIFSFVS